VIAQDINDLDTVRIGEYDWTIESHNDTVFSFGIWGWSDQDIKGSSLGFRLSIDTTGFDGVYDNPPGENRWHVYNQSTMNGYDVQDFYCSAMDSQIVFGDSTALGPDISNNVGVNIYSQLDVSYWSPAIEGTRQRPYDCNLAAIGPTTLFTPMMPSNQQNLLCTITLLIRDVSAVPKNFTIVVDSAYFPPAGPFKWTPTVGTGFVPSFVKGLIHVTMPADSLLLDADDVDDQTLPKAYELSQNYPNPFNPSTTVKFYNSQKGHVSLTIYNIMGQNVRTLVDQDMDIGWQEAVWDGLDNSGEHCSSGLYFYKMDANDFSQTKKMLLVK